MTVDPFAPSNDAASTGGDPFLDPTRGNFPKVGELLHKVLVMVPVEVTQTTKPNSNELQDRWSINTTVIHEDGTSETYDEMFWSQTGIANAAKKAFREKRPILGTLHLFPVLNTKKRYQTEEQLLQDEDVARWVSRGGTGLPPTPVAWGLEQVTPEQRKLALAWWNENMNPFGA
jgi:hypothetical protein